MELNPLMMSLIETNGNKIAHLAEEVSKFQEAITKLKQLQVDLHEYACMRATMLFKIGKLSILLAVCEKANKSNNDRCSL